MATLIVLPVTAFVPDTSPVVTGDNPATLVVHQDRPAYAFDSGADEEAIKSVEFEMPSQYTGSSGIACKIHYAAQNTLDDVQFDVRVEAKTPGTDTLNMGTAESFDVANTGTASFSGATAGDPKVMTITLTNSDGVAAGDLVRLLVRRDTPSVNDDAAVDVFVYGITLEDG